MSTGGHSFHMKDWMKLGGAAAAVAAPWALPAMFPALAGAGGAAAGGGGILGGLSGLLGGGSGAAGAVAPEALAGGLGAGAADEVMGGIGMAQGAPGLLGQGSVALSNFKTMNPMLSKGLGRLGVGMLNSSFQAPQPQQPQMPPSMGQQQPIQSSAQAMSGVFGDPNQSMANLTPEQRQMLMAQLMQQGH